MTTMSRKGGLTTVPKVAVLRAVAPSADSQSQSDDSDSIILPTWIYIKDRDGRFLYERSGPTYYTLAFGDGDPDLNCIFQAIKTSNPSSYRFVARSGHNIMRYYNGWYSSDADSSPSFKLTQATGDQVYMMDSYNPSLFFSNQVDDEGSPVAHDYINDSSQLEIVQAAVKNEIVNVVYDISGAQVVEMDPLIALHTTVRNDSDSDVSQALTYSYEKWSVGTWNNTAGIELGLKITFKAGVPFTASASSEVSVSASYSHEWGGEEGIKKTVTSTTTVAVPPKKKADATVLVKNSQIDVNFTYTQRVLWSNGTSEDIQQNGIYSNLDSWLVDVQLDNWDDV